jgi:hypothetical protein
MLLSFHPKQPLLPEIPAEFHFHSQSDFIVERFNGLNSLKIIILCNLNQKKLFSGASSWYSKFTLAGEDTQPGQERLKHKKKPH